MSETYIGEYDISTVSQEQRKNKFLCYKQGKINSHNDLDVATSFTTSDRSTCHTYQKRKK